MTQTEAPPEEGTKTGRRRLLWAVLGGALVALAALGWWFLGPASAAEEIPDEDGEIVELEPLTATIGEAGRQHARIRMAVVLTVVADSAVIEPRVALLDDALLKEVSATGGDELRTAEGADQLRVSMSEHARQIWGEDVARRVVFTELLVQ